MFIIVYSLPRIDYIFSHSAIKNKAVFSCFKVVNLENLISTFLFYLMGLLSVFPTWPTVEQALLGSASLLRAINIDHLAAIKEDDPVDNTLVSTSRLNESIQVSPIMKWPPKTGQ